jgi:o-succinylbenzoate---CoA ligase
MIHTGKADDPALTTDSRSMSYGEMDAQVMDMVREFQDRGVEPGDRVAIYHDDAPTCIIQLRAIMKMGAVACPVSTRWPESTMRDAAGRIGAKMILFNDRYEAMESSFSLDAEKASTIIFTSGSSGTPKAAIHSLSNHLESARASNRNIPLVPNDGWLLSLPLYHVGGLGILFRCFQGGATILVPGKMRSLEQSIQDDRVTHVSLVSTQLYRLLQSEEATAALAGKKAVLMGGSAMPDQLIARALDAGVPIHTSYGMTEMTTQITCTPPNGDAVTLRSSGASLIKDNLRISATGEIQVQGPTLFQGYFQDSGELSLPLTDDGWFQTRDRGHLDDQGYLHVTGRVDNQFISGGENIQPEEIEQTLCQLSGIQQAIVVPIDDPEFGQRPVALIRGETDWDEDDLKKTLRETLPGYMIPIRIVDWPDHLVPQGMKPDRVAIRGYVESV